MRVPDTVGTLHCTALHTLFLLLDLASRSTMLMDLWRSFAPSGNYPAGRGPFSPILRIIFEPL